MSHRFVDWLTTLLMLAVGPALLILMAGATLAARPTAPTVWVEEVAAEQTLHFGDHFSVGWDGRVREPWAYVSCQPNATTVYDTTYDDGTVWASVFSVWPDGPSPQDFVLGDSVFPLWTAGGADCTVSLVTYSRDLQRRTVHATSDFSVAP